MIFLIHGENEVEKHAYLDILRERQEQEIVSLNSQNLSSDELFQALRSQPLFYPKRLVILENFSLSGLDIDFVNIHSQVDLVALSSQKLTQEQIQKLPAPVKQILFKAEPHVFRFLDNLHPGGRKMALMHFRKIDNSQKSELLFRLIIQQIRRLLLAGEVSVKVLMEAERLLLWQAEKYAKLSGYFSKQSLLKIYRKLFALELSHKQGESNLSELWPSIIFELTRASQAS